MKHLRTEIEGSHKKRTYDKPQMPFERLKACGKDRRWEHLGTGIDKSHAQSLRAEKADREKATKGAASLDKPNDESGGVKLPTPEIAGAKMALLRCHQL